MEEVRRRPGFRLACKPWPFNVNFFYLPPRLRVAMEASCGGRTDTGALEESAGDVDDDCLYHIPDEISTELAAVSVALKLRLHKAGEMMIPYQVRNLGCRFILLLYPQ